jgi:surface protein
MSNNLDFGRTGSVRNLIVYGPTGTIPPNPVRFPNAYLTAPDYDLSGTIEPQYATKLTIYRSIPETRYPFTYIGTPAIQNIGYFGQINPLNAPKISVYQQVQGTLVFSYEYTGLLSLSVLASVNYLPIITGSALTIVNSNATKTENRVTVTVNINYVDDGSNFGLSFLANSIVIKDDYNFEHIFYNNTNIITDLSINTLTNIPLSRNGSQFANLRNISTNFFASNTVVPQILPNTSFNNMFYNCPNFDQPLNNWNTTNVTNMSNTFYNCTNFNQPLNNWITTNVTNMSNMFYHCTQFDQDIGNWNTVRVTTMQNMFYHCTQFDQPLNNWITTNVTNMSNMFTYAFAFNQDISGWNLSSIVLNQFYTLVGQLLFTFTCTTTVTFSSNYIPLIGIDTYFTITSRSLRITNDIEINMHAELSSNTSYTVTCQTLYYSNTANITNFGLSFYTDDGSKTRFYNTFVTDLSITTLKNIPLSKEGYQFANLTTALNANNNPSLFYSNTVIPLILPNTSFSFCFGSTSNIRSHFNSDISGWNTSNVTSLYSMFNNCNKFNQPLNSWNTSNVTNMTAMFIACSLFNRPLNNWLTNRVTEMRYMFHFATVFNQDLNDWDTSNVTTMEYMFSNARAFNQDIGKWNTSRVTNMNNMFVSAGKFTNQNLPMTNDYGSYNSWSWQFLPTSYTNWHLNCPLMPANAPTQLQGDPYW